LVDDAMICDLLLALDEELSGMCRATAEGAAAETLG
jgi:hypothetical protein